MIQCHNPVFGLIIGMIKFLNEANTIKLAREISSSLHIVAMGYCLVAMHPCIVANEIYEIRNTT